MNNELNQLEQDTAEDSSLYQSDLENINVNVWFNKLESRLQYCLVKNDAKDGFMQYKMLVSHAELLAISSRKISEVEYKVELKTAIEKEIGRSEEDDVKQMKEAMIKYRLILSNLLKEKKSTLNLSY